MFIRASNVAHKRRFVVAGLIVGTIAVTGAAGYAKTRPQIKPIPVLSNNIALPVSDFLDSLGVCTHMAQGIDNPVKSADCLTYAGIRNLRDDGRPSHVQDWIKVHEIAGVRTCLLSNQKIPETIAMAEELHRAGALLAVEGPNEPNNWPVTYEGQKSDYKTTALPIARFQAALYAAVKADPALKDVPVFHSSEAGGSEKDNAGLQFLTIPASAGTLMPDSTHFADFANTHNYVCGHSGKLVDNAGWNASDPVLNADWDGLYVEYGRTWHGHFDGYTREQLATLPRVCTETGWVTKGKGSITEEQQARVLLNLYLDGFRRGWKYTFVYMLRDDPNQGYWGLFGTDYQPKTSGRYLHNLTTILADGTTGDRTTRRAPALRRLAYSLVAPPATVHDLLLQKSDGTLELIVWDERVAGSDDVTVNLGSTYAGVKTCDPVTGVSPVSVPGRVESLKLSLSDHPVIIEIPAGVEAGR